MQLGLHSRLKFIKTSLFIEIQMMVMLSIIKQCLIFRSKDNESTIENYTLTALVSLIGAGASSASDVWVSRIF